MKLVDEAVIRVAKAFLQRQVVGIEDEKEHSGNDGEPGVIGLTLVRDDDQDG